jgi:hypothetical protein
MIRSRRSIATSDGVRRAEGGLQVAVLPQYANGALDYSSTRIAKWALSSPVLSTMDSQTRKPLRKRASVKAIMCTVRNIYIDSLQETIDVHDENVRLQLIVTIEQ